MAQLLSGEWQESLAREGLAPVAVAVAGDGAGEEPPCPACGATAALVGGACPECGLQLE